jgi:hypothetical protein
LGSSVPPPQNQPEAIQNHPYQNLHELMSQLYCHHISRLVPGVTSQLAQQDIVASVSASWGCPEGEIAIVSGQVSERGVHLLTSPPGARCGFFCRRRSKPYTVFASMPMEK